MKVDDLLSYRLNHDILDIMSKVKSNYTGQQTVIMNLKSISNELNKLTIEEISKSDNE